MTRIQQSNETITIKYGYVENSCGLIRENSAAGLPIETGDSSSTPTFSSFAQKLGFIAIPLAVLAGTFSGSAPIATCRVLRSTSVSEIRSVHDDLWWNTDEWSFCPEYISTSEVAELNALLALPSPIEIDFGLHEDF